MTSLKQFTRGPWQFSAAIRYATDLRREVGQHADTLREELRGAFAQQADVFRTARPEPPRQRDVPRWLTTALLVLTAVGVILLVVSRFVSP